MKYKVLAIVTIILTSVLTAQSGWSNDKDDFEDLAKFCAKFPNNSKCEGIETPISLKGRSGEEFSCNFEFDPGKLDQADECKINFDQQGITVYQELGEKLELIDDERATQEINIPQDRIFVTNYQVWNKIHRWELGFLTEETEQKASKTNFLVVLLDEKQAESFGSQARLLGTSKPKLVESLISKSVNASANIEKLLETGECEYCDLSNTDLSETELEEANLVGANLQGANLAGAKLEEAYLLGANLQGADLSQADLTGANLTFADLSESTAVSADFEGANLQSANLQSANLQQADLTAPAYLQQANLSNAILTNAELRGANFKRANLSQADLTGSDLRKIDVELKNIPGNYSFGEKFIDSSALISVLGVTSKGVDFFTNFSGANLKGVNLSQTKLDNVILKKANLANVDFSESDIEEEDLEEVNLCNVTLADGSKSDRDCK